MNKTRQYKFLLTFGVAFAVACTCNCSVVSAETKSQAQLLKMLEEQSARIAKLEELLATKESHKIKAKELKEIHKERISSKHDVFYNKGYNLTNSDSETPFSMTINGRMQFRYTGYDKSSKSTQANINDFEVERGRLEFSGYVGDPNLHYYLNLDADTDDNHDVKAHDFWFNYVFSEAFDLYVGKAFVPGSREWLDGSTSTHLADRSLATSFFRPDRSVGTWAIGKLNDVNYRFMVGNGFSTSDLEREEIDNDFTYALSLWGDLIGEYGKGRADLEYHDDLAFRIGSSFTYSPISANPDGEPTGEADAVRLSNGTRLDSTGALLADATVTDYDIFLYAVDLGLKYKGFSINSEAYYRNIQNIKADLSLADSNMADKGFYADVGYFIVPQVWEPVIRYSLVDGDYGDFSEYAGGINYYINKTHLNKLTFDVARINDSGVSNSGPNYLVGQDGLLYRVQWQVGF
jgi:hypothetical protein